MLGESVAGRKRQLPARQPATSGGSKACRKPGVIIIVPPNARMPIQLTMNINRELANAFSEPVGFHGRPNGGGEGGVRSSRAASDRCAAAGAGPQRPRGADSGGGRRGRGSPQRRRGQAQMNASQILFDRVISRLPPITMSPLSLQVRSVQSFSLAFWVALPWRHIATVHVL